MAKIGHKQSIKTKNKRSESLKKWWKSPEGLLKKQRVAKRLIRERKNKTYIQIYGNRAEEIKRKIGNGQKGIPKTVEHNKKNGEAHKGKRREPFSNEWIENLRKAQKIRVQNGIHNFWIDGRSLENNPYPEDWSNILRKGIRQRDSYICQECDIHQDKLNYKLDVHHIDYDKKNLNSNNLISLCRGCHVKTNFNRNFWITYFNQKIYETI